MKFLNYNPYDYNTIALKNSKVKVGEGGFVKTEVTPDMQTVINDPVENFVGHFFGIQNKPDWAKYYDKVSDITEWARRKTGSNDIKKITDAISEKLNSTPSLNERRIIDFHIQTKLDGLSKPNQDYNGNDKKEEVTG